MELLKDSRKNLIKKYKYEVIITPIYHEEETVYELPPFYGYGNSRPTNEQLENIVYMGIKDIEIKSINDERKKNPNKKDFSYVRKHINTIYKNASYEVNIISA